MCQTCDGPAITSDATTLDIKAYGGSRRARGARIAAEVRRLRRAGVIGERFHISYSETPGFNTMTHARYYRTRPVVTLKLDEEDGGCYALIPAGASIEAIRSALAEAEQAGYELIGSDQSFDGPDILRDGSRRVWLAA
jgi:hypothetical protein